MSGAGQLSGIPSRMCSENADVTHGMRAQFHEIR